MLKFNLNNDVGLDVKDKLDYKDQMECKDQLDGKDGLDDNDRLFDNNNTCIDGFINNFNSKNSDFQYGGIDYRNSYLNTFGSTILGNTTTNHRTNTKGHQATRPQDNMNYILVFELIKIINGQQQLLNQIYGYKNYKNYTENYAYNGIKSNHRKCWNGMNCYYAKHGFCKFSHSENNFYNNKIYEKSTKSQYISEKVSKEHNFKEKDFHKINKTNSNSNSNSKQSKNLKNFPHDEKYTEKSKKSKSLDKILEVCLNSMVKKGVSSSNKINLDKSFRKIGDPSSTFNSKKTKNFKNCSKSKNFLEKSNKLKKSEKLEKLKKKSFKNSNNFEKFSRETEKKIPTTSNISIKSSIPKKPEKAIEKSENFEKFTEKNKNSKNYFKKPDNIPQKKLKKKQTKLSNKVVEEFKKSQSSHNKISVKNNFKKYFDFSNLSKASIKTNTYIICSYCLHNPAFMRCPEDCSRENICKNYILQNKYENVCGENTAILCPGIYSVLTDKMIAELEKEWR